jgi:Tfp pilus assembly protein PilN
MKQRINLYLSDLRPVKDPLSLNNIALSWAIVLVICIGYMGILMYVNKDLTQELTKVKRNLTQQTAQVNELQAALAVKQDKTFLSQQLNKFKKEYQHKEMMLKYISDKNNEDKISYADVMSDLAQFHHSDVWLTEFQFLNNEIVLKGLTQSPSKLPYWFDGLKQSAFFSGKSFSVLEFTHVDEQSKVEFRVATTNKGDNS